MLKKSVVEPRLCRSVIFILDQEKSSSAGRGHVDVPAEITECVVQAKFGSQGNGPGRLRRCL